MAQPAQSRNARRCHYVWPCYCSVSGIVTFLPVVHFTIMILLAGMASRIELVKIIMSL